MSEDNSKARRRLEKIYGKGCMFKKAHIEEQIEALQTKRVIKSYKVFLKETRYTGKKIRQLEGNMTYHHLRHRSEGGKTDVENGAIVNEMAHRYIHSLPREDEEVINNMLRKFKIQGGTLIATEQGLQIQDSFGIDLDYELNDEDVITIPVYDNTKEDYIKRQKFNRAKVKRETQRFIDDELDFMEELEDEER